MKKARKLLVALLVLTFLLSTFNVGFAATAADKDLPSHVVRAIALGYLKGFEDGDLKLDQPITRAQALAFVVRISGLEASAELMKGQTQFADVNNDPSLQWATGYINLGVGQGIVNGYPDGTFKGNNQVTYAEMAKMLLYAMNYGVTVEGAAWPAGVMGKADDLGIFDKVNAAPNVPALRGDAVKMIDNSLTIHHLVQKGYGDLKYFDEGDETFLSKLKVEELEEYQVIEVAKVVDSKLEDDEIIVEKEIRPGSYDTRTLKLIADVNPEAIFGLTVNAWVNDDDEVFFVDVKTEAKNIIVDTVADTIAGTTDKVKLLVADKEYKFNGDANIYVNFDKVTGSISDDQFNNMFGKFVLDRGEIVFATLFDFDDKDGGVVTDVSGQKIKYFKTNDSTRTLNLDDYDAYYIYDKNLNAVELDEIDEDSVIFWYVNDDDEIFIFVSNDKVEGELTKAKADEIYVDGDKYKTSVFRCTISDNNNDDVVVYAPELDQVDNLFGEEVVLLLDLNGRVRHITGKADTVSGTNYGVLTDLYRSGKAYYASIFTKEGKFVEYKFEKNSDTDQFDDLDTVKYYVVKFKLNSDGEIAEDQIEPVTFDASNVTPLTFDDEKDKINNYYVTSDTILFNVEPIDEDKDPKLVKWDDIKNKDGRGLTASFVVDKLDLKVVVFTDGMDSAISDSEYGIVTTAPWREADGWKVELNVFGEGKKEIFLSNDSIRNSFKAGYLVEFTLNTADKLADGGFDVNSAISGYDVTQAVYKVDGNYIVLDAADPENWVRIAKDAVVYMMKDKAQFDASGNIINRSTKIDRELTYSDIDEGDVIEVVKNDDGVIVLVIIWPGIVTP